MTQELVDFIFQGCGDEQREMTSQMEMEKVKFVEAGKSEESFV